MAGLSTAWRLSEPGWQDRFESITIYQRGWRLGGKAASSRGRNGRIQEHGLHLWLGCYENAFGLLRECYAELDREVTDPQAPVRTWDKALVPTDKVGVADKFGDDWLIWPGTFSRNNQLPGDPDGCGRAMTAVDFVAHAAQLVLDFTDSIRETANYGLVLSGSSSRPPAASVSAVRRGLVAAFAALSDPKAAGDSGTLDRALAAIRNELDYDESPQHKRSWLLISLVVASIRGILADNLITDARGFRALNDEDFSHWVLRHGAHPDVVDFSFVRGLHDLVFGYEDADPAKPSFSAGVGAFLAGLALFGYKGAMFWKMTAGMGDVVIAPLYEALHRRGVKFEFFHRLEALHLDHQRLAVDAISVSRQVFLAEGAECYEPLTRVKGLPVFPDKPLIEQLIPGQEPPGGWHSLETHWSEHNDAETRVLRRGQDFDHVVLAVSVGMVPVVAGELIKDSRAWREMAERIRTVATHAIQLWLRPDEATLGWHEPGVTISGYLPPFETWASMPQTLWAEDWPDSDLPCTVAYYCGSMQAPWLPGEANPEYASRYEHSVRQEAVSYIDSHLRRYFPNAYDANGFDWQLLNGVDGEQGIDALNTQHISVNVDPSDRYVQSIPGTDRYRIRPDESGYDNLSLAGDWTDCGLNAGCIEAAVVSGLQAANAVLGRGRYYRLRGFYLP